MRVLNEEDSFGSGRQRCQVSGSKDRIVPGSAARELGLYPRQAVCGPAKVPGRYHARTWPELFMSQRGMRENVDFETAVLDQSLHSPA
jgi:hypothetical protein